MTRNLALTPAALLATAGIARAGCPAPDLAPDPAPDPAPPRDEASQPPAPAGQALVHERYVVLEPDAQGQMRPVTRTRWIWRDLPTAPCGDPPEPAGGSDG